MKDITSTLICLILPPNCQCEKVPPRTYRIKCSDFGTAKGVWEHCFESVYPLLKQGDIMEVIGEEFEVQSCPKP